MTKKEFTVVSDYDGLKLQGIVFEPEGTPKGIVQLVHGMCEYKKRYEPFMQFLCENGYVAACHDHRGHGDSVENEADLGWFGDLSGNAIVEDAAQVTEYLKREYPDLSVTLFGHSMGSMVTRCYLREHDGLIDKAIICGSPSKNPLAGAGIFLERCIRLFRGERYRSKLLTYLATGNGDDRFPEEEKGAWLTRDRSMIVEFYGDPKCGYRFTCNGFENLFKLLKRSYKKKGHKLQNPDLPVHCVAGSDDAVIVNKKKWQKSVEFLREVGYKNVSGKIYEGMRHEILNEWGKEEVYADLLAFIEGE